MFQYNNISTRQTFLMSYIYTAFRNIVYAFSCDCKQNISVLKVFLTQQF